MKKIVFLFAFLFLAGNLNLNALNANPVGETSKAVLSQKTITKTTADAAGFPHCIFTFVEFTICDEYGCDTSVVLVDVDCYYY